MIMSLLMKILVTSDIHANFEALTAVLEAAQGQYDGVISLGDIVGYGPDPEACVMRLKQLTKTVKPCILLAGNHDAGLLKKLSVRWFSDNARHSLKNTAPLVSWKTRFFLARLHPVFLLSEKTLLVHGSPLEPLTEYLTGGQETEDSLQYLSAEGFRLCFCGHTHQAAVFYADRREYGALYPAPGQTVLLDKECSIVNPGSVGYPRALTPTAHTATAFDDKAHYPAYFLLWDTAAHSVTFNAAYYVARITNEKITRRLGTALL